MSSPESRIIRKLPSGPVCLADMQFLRGYCILEAEPQVASINELNEDARSCFLLDMARVGDALLKITGAYRINYAIMGNSQPVLHAHIVPRYKNEPEEYLHGLPWSYPDSVLSSRLFDPILDRELLEKIAVLLG